MPTEQQLLDKWDELGARRTTENEDILDLLRHFGVTIDPPRTIWDDARELLVARGLNRGSAETAVLLLQKAGFDLVRKEGV